MPISSSGKRFVVIAWIVFVASLLAGRAHALTLRLDRPGDREFVRDLADLVTLPDEDKLKVTSSRLLDELHTPIIVITINSMAQYGGEDLRIETFATLLFDQWQIGHATRNGEPWNTGILLLVSKNDRKARIELGAGWRREQDAEALRIMDTEIIPRFKTGQFSAGIVAGVAALDAMARRTLPATSGSPRPAAPPAPAPAAPPVVLTPTPPAPAAPPRVDVEVDPSRPTSPVPTPTPPRTYVPPPSAPPSPEVYRSSSSRGMGAGGMMSSGCVCFAAIAVLVLFMLFSAGRKLLGGIGGSGSNISGGGIGRSIGSSLGSNLGTGLGLLATILANSQSSSRRRSMFDDDSFSGGRSSSSFGFGNSGFGSRSSGFGSSSSSFGSSSSSGSSSSFGGGHSGGGGATGSW